MQQQVILIIIGAAIGFISSIGTTIVAELIRRQGKVKVFYKIVFSKVHNGRTWGFHNGSSGMVFEVPMWIELQNTSNTTRVIRDLNILLFKDGKEMAQMVQITNKDEEVWYGNKGAYSFVVEPRSLNKYDLHFLIKKNEMVNNHQFDEIRLRYFDEKDRKYIYRLCKIEQCWELGDLNRDGSWKLAIK